MTINIKQPVGVVNAMRQQAIVTTSWDDGHSLDLKLADLLDSLGLPGTFYIPLSNSEREVMSHACVTQLAQRFEIGGHTRSHKALSGLRNCDLEDEVIGGKHQLEDVMGRCVKMFSYPMGKHNHRVRQIVARAGFAGARTTKELVIDPDDDNFQMPTTLQAFPHTSWVRFRHTVSTRNLKGIGRQLACLATTWTEIARQLFFEVLEYGGVWHLWGHSWEIEQESLWEELQDLLRTVAGHENVTYLNNYEVLQQLENSAMFNTAEPIADSNSCARILT